MYYFLLAGKISWKDNYISLVMKLRFRNVLPHLRSTTERMVKSGLHLSQTFWLFQLPWGSISIFKGQREATNTVNVLSKRTMQTTDVCRCHFKVIYSKKWEREWKPTFSELPQHYTKIMFKCSFIHSYTQLTFIGAF